MLNQFYLPFHCLYVQQMQFPEEYGGKEANSETLTSNVTKIHLESDNNFINKKQHVVNQELKTNQQKKLKSYRTFEQKSYPNLNFDAS